MVHAFDGRRITLKVRDDLDSFSLTLRATFHWTITRASSVTTASAQLLASSTKSIPKVRSVHFLSLVDHVLPLIRTLVFSDFLIVDGWPYGSLLLPDVRWHFAKLPVKTAYTCVISCLHQAINVTLQREYFTFLDHQFLLEYLIDPKHPLFIIFYLLVVLKNSLHLFLQDLNLLLSILINKHVFFFRSLKDINLGSQLGDGQVFWKQGVVIL